MARAAQCISVIFQTARLGEQLFLISPFKVASIDTQVYKVQAFKVTRVHEYVRDLIITDIGYPRFLSRGNESIQTYVRLYVHARKR